MKNSFARKKAGDGSHPVGNNRSGLCAFCFIAPQCILVNSSKVSILECEEFRAYEPVQETEMTGTTHSKSNPVEESQSETSEHLHNNGLCKDCKIYNSCPFPKNRGDVWCCEEYR